MSRILFVSIQGSPHTARWVDCLANSGLDLHMFGIDQHPPNRLLRNVTLHWPTDARRSAPALALAGGRLSLSMRVRRFLAHARAEPKDALRIVQDKFLRALPSPRSRESFSRKRITSDRAAAPPIRILPFVSQPPTQFGGRIPFGDTGADCDALHGPAVLTDVIRSVKPDLIHSMEFQHCAYLVLAARDLIGPEQFPPWLATNWGSDIYLFGRDPQHAPMIRRVLETADLYSCECHRDTALARQFGYLGPDLPVLPNSGGMDLKHVAELRSAPRPSKRKLIMVKGYDHFAGRALISLDVLERFAKQLDGYEIVMFSVSARPRARALKLKASGKLNIRVIDFAEHDEILWHFGRARIYLGISISDAISTSVLEAMAMGCFPIQTDTSCCQEWFESGVGGFAIPHDDFETICMRFDRALHDDALVDRAAEINKRRIEQSLAREIIVPQVHEFYRAALDYGTRR